MCQGKDWGTLCSHNYMLKAIHLCVGILLLLIRLHIPDEVITAQAYSSKLQWFILTVAIQDKPVEAVSKQGKKRSPKIWHRLASNQRDADWSGNEVPFWVIKLAQVVCFKQQCSTLTREAHSFPDGGTVIQHTHFGSNMAMWLRNLGNIKLCLI